MNESIKDRFLKEHELSMDDLEKVAGGNPAAFDGDGDGQGECQNPACSHFKCCVMVYLNSCGGFYICSYCRDIIPNDLVDPRQ